MALEGGELVRNGGGVADFAEGEDALGGDGVFVEAGEGFTVGAGEEGAAPGGVVHLGGGGGIHGEIDGAGDIEGFFAGGESDLRSARPGYRGRGGRCGGRDWWGR